MHITVYQGAPGSRKTLTFLDTALDNPGLYLVAFPRNALIDEQAAYCLRKAAQIGAAPSILPIHTDQSCHRGQVGRRIKKALEAEAGQSHVVMMISHAALLGLDPALLAGWHVAIDENLDGSVVSGIFKASTSWSVLDRHFRLDPLPGGQTWEVLPHEEVAPPTRKAITAEGKNGLSAFLTYASQPRRSVFVDVGDWRDAQLGRPVRWWSIWSPLILSRCAAVTLIGAGYFESIPYYASEWLAPRAVTYAAGPKLTVQRANPRVRIHYYTRGHVGSTAWWDTDEGHHCLLQVSDHQKLIGGPGYWSSNEAIRLVFRGRFPGEWCSPKQAGTNGLIRHTSCLYIYSAKPQMDDAPIIDLLGLDRDAVRRAREFEDIRQFALRGALRRPDYAGTYDIYLYDLAQAQDLEAYLRGIGIADLELVPVVEAGVMDVVRPGSAVVAQKAPLSREERQKRNTASQKEKRAKVRAEEKAKGIERKRGRPTKPPVDLEPIAP
uniref:Uncharacterized protein n=1 Tax=Bosea sp. NBC_00436 TaxID=2969620 RepID=A0A9E8CS81_9HYPH